MYLKKIEALGFKSFADRTVLEFGPGIMGIVGPNGSGKSNVADAVRWVLGEQSAKQLRGSNMQDVIFSGTETRRPQGFAWVELTIDNADHRLEVDYDEVSVARRVYRSGESEYLLNGKNCRLRDIQELFADTGVGREGYSIIGQGQIDQIVSGRPEDRRELFDEAAGIVKYKRRKHLTEKKLETEEENLVRVTDILNELEKQVEPLRDQAEKAQEYRKQEEKLRCADIRAFRLASADLKKRRQEAQENLSAARNDQQRLNRESEHLRTAEEETAQREKRQEEEAAAKREELTGRQVRCENLEGQRKILDEQIRTAGESEAQIRARIGTVREEIQNREKEEQELQREREALEQERTQAEKEADRLQQEQDRVREEIRRQEKSLSESQSRERTLLEERAELAASVREWETRLSQGERERTQREKETAADERQDRKLAEQEKSLEQTLAEWEAEEAQQRERLKDLERERREAQEELRRQNAAFAEESRRCAAEQSRRDSLRDMTERYEGYGSSIRRVMQKREQVPGIRGVVADLLHTEPRFETAIETALGGRIQNIVTDTEQTARELIGYLKRERLGRATFLPVTSVRGTRFPRPEALKEPGALGVAADLVETGEEYRGVAEYLLGRTLVADTMEHALAIAAKYHYSLTLVTLEGELLSPGGSMTGGSYRNNSSLLGRRREIRELSQRVSQARKRIESGRQEIKKLETKIDALQEEASEVSQDIARIALEKNTLSVDAGHCRAQREKLANESADHRKALAALQRQMDEWTREKDEQSERGAALEEELTGLSAGGEKENRELDARREELEALSARTAQLRQDAAARRQRMDFLEENRKRLTSERQELEEERDSLAGSLEGGKKQAKEREAAREKLRDELEEEREACRRLTRGMEACTDEKSRLAARRQKISGDREALAGQIRDLDREVLRLQNQTERREEEEDELVNSLWNEYGMTPSDAEQTPVPDGMTLAQSRRTAAELKAELRKLGPVNLNAIEEYRKVSERYEFLKSQHEDLTETADRLKKIIRELESGMRRQFEEKFARIRTEFGQVFQELFGGGQADLSLEEGADILDAGILIQARPPGKKLKNILQLSGGEKALTAIALLFAIQNLKPSPFCLLDEIEASLDEPNVERYAKYLDRLKERTQFIVITHRRGTMEMAGRLYGITMQEKGVSALISVDLSDEALDELTKEA